MTVGELYFLVDLLLEMLQSLFELLLQVELIDLGELGDHHECFSVILQTDKCFRQFRQFKIFRLGDTRKKQIAHPLLMTLVTIVIVVYLLVGIRIAI